MTNTRTRPFSGIRISLFSFISCVTAVLFSEFYEIIRDGGIGVWAIGQFIYLAKWQAGPAVIGDEARTRLAGRSLHFAAPV